MKNAFTQKKLANLKFKSHKINFFFLLRHNNKRRALMFWSFDVWANEVEFSLDYFASFVDLSFYCATTTSKTARRKSNNNLQSLNSNLNVLSLFDWISGRQKKKRWRLKWQVTRQGRITNASLRKFDLQHLTAAGAKEFVFFSLSSLVDLCTDLVWVEILLVWQSLQMKKKRRKEEAKLSLSLSLFLACYCRLMTQQQRANGLQMVCLLAGHKQKNER